MTNTEVRKILEKNGLSAQEIKLLQDKFDFEKINDTVKKASNPSEAFEALHKLYPELKVEKLKNQSNFMMSQISAAVDEVKQKGPMELSQEELENVAGGGIFSDIGNWFSNHWKEILVGAAIIVAGAAVTSLTLGAGGALISGVLSVVMGTDTFLAGAAFGASVGAAAGAIFGAGGGLLADVAGGAKSLVDTFWS